MLIQPLTYLIRGLRNAAPKPRITSALALCLLVCTTQAQPASSPDFAATIAALDAPDYATRADATDALLTDAQWNIDRLAELYAQATTAEQRHRIRRAARHHSLVVMRTEKFEGGGGGSLGVVHAVQKIGPPVEAQEMQQGYAQIIRVLPGFPAAGRLQPGDRVTAVDDQPVMGTDGATSFEKLLQMRPAGDTIALTVQRGTQTLRIEIELASNKALGMYGPPDHSLTEPYQIEWLRLRDLRFPDPTPG